MMLRNVDQRILRLLDTKTSGRVVFGLSLDLSACEVFIYYILSVCLSVTMSVKLVEPGHLWLILIPLINEETIVCGGE